MAKSRAELRADLAGELGSVVTLASFTTADTTGNLKEPLDRTFRALGAAEASLSAGAAPDGSEQKALAYGRYFVLARATDALVNKMNVSAGSAKANLREQYENVRERMVAALYDANRYGLGIAVDGSGGINPLPYAGGISKADYDSIADDSDRTTPLFRLWM